MSDGFIIRSPLRSSTFCAAIQSTGRHEAEWTLGTRDGDLKKVILARIVIVIPGRIVIVARIVIIVIILQFISKNHNDTKIIDRPDLARKFVPLLGEENSIQVCCGGKSPIYSMFSLL